MDPGSVAIGMLVSLVGWGVFIFAIFLPKIKGLQTYFEEKEKLYMEKIDNILEGKDEGVNAILDKKLPEMAEKGWDTILDKLTGPPDPRLILAVKTMAGGAFYAIKDDPDIKRSIQGEINGKMNGVVRQIEGRIGFAEEDIKNLREMIAFFNANKEKFAKYANMAPGSGGGGFDPTQLMGMFMPGMGQQ